MLKWIIKTNDIDKLADNYQVGKLNNFPIVHIDYPKTDMGQYEITYNMIGMLSIIQKEDSLEVAEKRAEQTVLEWMDRLGLTYKDSK